MTKRAKYLLAGLVVLIPFLMGTYKYPATLWDGTTSQILVGGGAGSAPVWGTDIPTAVTIGSKYVYRADGTDIPIADGGTGQSTAAGAFGALKQAATESESGVSELATNAEALTGTDTERTVTPDDLKYVLDRRNINQVNLFKNSGFGVISNSEDLYTTAGTVPAVGDAYCLIEDNSAGSGDDWTGASGATPPTGWSVTEAGVYTITDSGDGAPYDACLKVEVNATPTANPGIYHDFTVEVGKLYEVSVYFKHGTATSGHIYLGSTTRNNQYYDSGALTDAAWTQYTHVLEATTTTLSVSLYITSSATGQYELFDEVRVHEVSPGIVGANTLGPDGWGKNSGLDIYREYKGSNAKDGSFYSIKSVPSAQNEDGFYPNVNEYNKEPWLTLIAGRTMTLGAWVKTSTASDLVLYHYNTVAGNTSSSAHTGGGGWEWLEITVTPDASSTTSFFGWRHINASPGTAYISQPTLVFGSAIGEGNYVQPPGDQILFEAPVTLTDYSAVTAADATIILESQSDGKIPKGTKAVFVEATGTGNAGTDKVVFYESSSKALPWLTLNSPGSNPWTVSGWVGCDSNGDIYIDDTGSMGTFTIKILGVQVN